MKIENRLCKIKRQQQNYWLDTIATWVTEQLKPNEYPLRFAIVAVDDEEVQIEVTTLEYSADSAYAEELEKIEILTPRKKNFQSTRFGVAQIIPTGVRCEFGGYAGDACPATNLLAAASDFVVTHPNSVNASELNELADNVLYVEGKSLDDFLLGHIGLMEINSNKIGTFVDPTGLEYLDHVINTIHAANAVKGVDCGMYQRLPVELGVKVEWTDEGCAVGTVQRPDAILESVESLVNAGATAVGAVSVLHGITESMFANHLEGSIPNPSGGVEAIITHLISKIFKIPTAHAPLPYYQDLKENSTSNPRASAEFISIPHYFCVLKGLSKAPRLVDIDGLENPPPHLVTLNHIGAVVMPASCLGGVPALAAEYSDIPLIAVRENDTILDVNNSKMNMSNVIEVESYLEAAGVVMALREGIALSSLKRPLGCAKEIVREHVEALSVEPIAELEPA